MIPLTLKMKNYLNSLLPYDNKDKIWPQIYVIFTVTLGSFTASAQFSWTSPSIPILISNSSHMNVLTLEEASYFSILPPIATAISAPLISLLTDIIGRRKTVMFMAVPHILAWILIAAAKNIHLLYLSRALSGVSDAILFSTIPTYVGEVAIPSVRGSWGNMVAVGVYFGQFLVNVIGAYFDIYTTALIFLSVPILQVVLLLFAPESPYYLIMKKKEDEARTALKRLRWNENVEQEFKSLIKDVNRQISESGTYKDLFTIKVNRKALIISIALRGCQQLSGLPAFAVYTQYMFNKAGGNFSASTSSIIYTAVLLVMSTAAAFLVDKLGRKILMTFSSLSCAFILATQATYFYFNDNTDIDLSQFNWFPLTGMLIYIVVCSSGISIIPTLMLGELFSASVKSKALAILNISFALYILTVSKMFQVLTSNYGLYVPFYLFCFFCVLSTIFSHFYLPETKGRTLETIQQELRGNM